jgi:hypothetical protein
MNIIKDFMKAARHRALCLALSMYALLPIGDIASSEVTTGDLLMDSQSEERDIEEILILQEYVKALEAAHKSELTGLVALRDGSEKTPPLHSAVKSGLIEFVQELLTAGVKANTWDFYTKTPLHYAVEIADANTRFEIVRLLVMHGASVLVEDFWGKIPLEYVKDPGLRHYLEVRVDEEQKARCPVFNDKLFAPDPQVKPSAYYLLQDISR